MADTICRTAQQMLKAERFPVSDSMMTSTRALWGFLGRVRPTHRDGRRLLAIAMNR